MHKLRFAYPFLLFMGWTCSAHAQGYSSYGGILGDVIGVVLILLLIAVVLVLLAVRYFFGKRAARVLLALLLFGFASLTIYNINRAAARSVSDHQKQLAWAKGCTATTRVIAQRARGDERIFVRLQGADQLTENQRNELLPSKDRLGERVELVTEVPADATNAIVVDIRYSRAPLPGSTSPTDYQRTKYEINALTFPEGKVVASTIDMEARTGFCLGDLEPFLRKALNRSGVLHKSEAGSVGPRMPDAYVHANFAGTTKGVFPKSPIIRNTEEEYKALFGHQGCPITEDRHRGFSALCGAPKAPVEVPLFRNVGIYQLANSWLLIYKLNKGSERLTSMLVEQRGADWQLLRTWHASLVPDESNTDNERLDEFAIYGEAMTVAVYWGFKRGTKRHYTYRSVLTVPLPGLQN